MNTSMSVSEWKCSNKYRFSSLFSIFQILLKINIWGIFDTDREETHEFYFMSYYFYIPK